MEDFDLIVRNLENETEGVIARLLTTYDSVDEGVARRYAEQIRAKIRKVMTALEHADRLGNRALTNSVKANNKKG